MLTMNTLRKLIIDNQYHLDLIHVLICLDIVISANSLRVQLWNCPRFPCATISAFSIVDDLVS